MLQSRQTEYCILPWPVSYCRAPYRLARRVHLQNRSQRWPLLLTLTPDKPWESPDWFYQFGSRNNLIFINRHFVYRLDKPRASYLSWNKYPCCSFTSVYGSPSVQMLSLFTTWSRSCWPASSYSDVAAILQMSEVLSDEYLNLETN